MRRVWAAAGVWALLAAPAAAQELLQNPGFTAWADGTPVGWRVDVGARNGEGPEALCVPLGDAGLSLSGDRTTRIWKAVSQQFAATPANAYRLTFEARVGGRRREGHQFHNCWVGFFFADAAGGRLAVEVYDVRSPEWQTGRLAVVPPAGTAAATVTVFLSETGTLQVRGLRLETLPPKRSDVAFDLLVQAMDRHYSYFAHKKIDWRALAATYRPRAAAAETPPALTEVLRELLGELEDLHVTVAPPGGPPQPTCLIRPPFNLLIEHVLGRVHTQQRVGRHLLVGRTKEGWGYALVAGLPGDPAVAEQMAVLFETLGDRPGLILDLRANSGGDERTAQTLLRSCIDTRRVYAQHAFRAGPGYDEFTPPQQRVIKPPPGATGARYHGPVVALIGPHTVSSGEAMALMCKALPGITLMGQPTRGASGNPAPVTLPDGVTVTFSRWVSMLPDGSLFEGTGIAPDILVPHPRDAVDDPTFERACTWLAEQVAAAGR